MLSSMAVVGTMIVSALTAPVAGTLNVGSVLPAPPTDRVVIDVVTVNGSGCPAGTTAVAATPDNTAFTVTYSSYLAQVGVGAAPTDFRKNCQLNIIVHVPGGFTYAIAKADHRGFASLAPGATGTERAGYYFTGDTPTVYRQHTYYGAMSNNWAASDVTAAADLVWAPCGVYRNLNINTEILVNRGSSNTSTTTSFMTMDSTDSSVHTVYHFAWRRC
jgi:hypothetical protein